MSNKNKSLGTSHETAIKTWLRSNGWPYADRKTQTGAKDEGDLRLSERVPFVVEAKSSRSTTSKLSLSTFVKELIDEVENSGSEEGAVIIKKQGTTDVGHYYALMPVYMLNSLLHKAYPES
jgi:hypothetical protein